MKLTNKQLEIVVDEIYNQISKPIIEANNKALNSIIIEEDNYLKDRKKYLKLQAKVDKLIDEINTLKSIYDRGTVYNSYKFTSWSNPFDKSIYTDYLETQRKDRVVLAEFPSKNEIERQVILAGNKDIPAIIETIVNKFKG
jgi:isoleucyl-tRNA synthetase